MALIPAGPSPSMNARTPEAILFCAKTPPTLTVTAAVPLTVDADADGEDERLDLLRAERGQPQLVAGR